MPLTLEQALAAAEAAARHAARLDIAVSVAVVDEGGHLKLLQRMDGAAALTGRISEAKASGAAEFLRTGEQLAGLSEHRELFFRAASTMTRLPLVPAAGSVILRAHGMPTGAIGVSGGTPEQDLECAEAAARAIG